MAFLPRKPYRLSKEGKSATISQSGMDGVGVHVSWDCKTVRLSSVTESGGCCSAQKSVMAKQDRNRLPFFFPLAVNLSA